MTDHRKEFKLQDEKKFNLKSFFVNKIARYWYLYIICLAIALGLAYYYNWYTTPVYYATGTLLINDDKRNMTTQDLLSQVSNIDNTGGIDNEIELIQSRSMIAKTLRRLDFEVSYLLKGNFKKSELYKQTPVKIVFDSLSYKVYGKPIDIKVIDNKTYEISYDLSKTQETTTAVHSFGETVHSSIGKFKMEKTANFRDSLFITPEFEKRNFVIYVHNFDHLIDTYSKALNIQFVSKKATVIELTLQDPVPQKAGDFLNMLMEVYIQSGIDNKNEIATNSLNFIDDQLELITADLKASEESLESFKTEMGITDISTEAQSFLGSVQVYDARISEIDIQTSFLQYLENYIQQDKELDKISPASLGIADPLLTKLITQLSDLQNQRKSQINSTTSDNPIVVTLDIQIQNTKEDLLENVRSIKDGLKASRQQAEIQLNRVQGKIKSVPATQRKLIGMERQATIREGLFNYLLQKKAETAIMLASTISDNRIVNSARASYKPVHPIPNQTYTIALLLGMLLPAFSIYLKDMLDDKIKDIGDIENITDIPILGVIGFTKENENMVVAAKPESMIAESFRLIRTNIQFFSNTNACIRILVTSSISSEGKSFCAANLAAIYAISGKKVILVNGDLRKPKKNTEFNLPNDIGISNYLIGASPAQDVIQSSPVVPNLDIVLSGPKPPNPSELIINPRMDDFFQYLESRYEVIIVDSPPIGIITDGLAFIKYIDTTIYIIRESVTHRRNIEFVNNLYRNKKIANLGIIFNAVKTGQMYGYGYNDNYGYGYYNEDQKVS
ncbi:MAG: polysaccharide biosynthesis tyrosine autokinase [Bacteroidota bacterium]|nr:polysaccharide biosynthesis tyrosine autokinase [Bacteroidota bacterium]